MTIAIIRRDIIDRGHEIHVKLDNIDMRYKSREAFLVIRQINSIVLLKNIYGQRFSGYSIDFEFLEAP